MIDDPFTPAPGAVPSVLAGRDDAVSEINDLIDGAYEQRWQQNLLIVGATGMGKSALLRLAARTAGELGWPVLRLIISQELSSSDGLSTAISRGLDSLKSENSLLARAASAARKLPIRPRTPWFEFITPSYSPNALALTEALNGLEQFAIDLQVPALLLIDEIHQLQYESASALINAISDRDTPLIILAAGLSSAWDTLMFLPATPASRMFFPLELQRLTPDEAVRVLCETAGNAGAVWSSDLVKPAAVCSFGVPAQVQEIGSLLWRSSQNDLDERNVIEVVEKHLARRRNVIRRYLSRLPISAIGVLGKLVSAQDRGEFVPLLALRSMNIEDAELRDAMDILERAGLVLLNENQEVSLMTDQNFLRDALPAGLNLRYELESGD